MKKFLIVLLISLFCFIPVNAKEEKYKIISGDIYDVGSEICFDTECFYVIENNGNIVKMLAKYNLYAGGFFDYYEPDYFNSWKEYGDEATGIQDSSMGEDETGIKGAAGFWSGDRYWLDENNNFKKHYGSESPTYVYDSNCDMYKYVENYHKYLESLSIPVHKTRLISFQELEKLGCNGKKYSCENAPNWVYSTAYWSGSASQWEAWGVTKYKSFDNWSDDYNYASRYGIRPVIEVPVSYFGDEGVIYIGSINKNNTSDGVVSNSDHNVDLIFNELGQSVKYQTTIYNTKNKNMYVNDIVIKNSSEKFIRVRLDTKSENMIIEPNGSSLVTFYIETALEEGAGRNLNDNVTIDFIISDKNFNPETFSNIIEFIILIIILCTVLFLIKSKK